MKAVGTKGNCEKHSQRNRNNHIHIEFLFEVKTEQWEFWFMVQYTINMKTTH